MKVSSVLLKMKRPLTVLVEGNIAAGKSLFIDRFRGNPEIQVLQEPIHKWRNMNGINLLQLMYEDPVRWSMTFQTYVQLTMLDQHLECGAPVKIMERSIYSARYCFKENLKNSGKMTLSEYEVLDSWFKFITAGSQFDVGADLIVYLKTCPETAYERVKLRNRGEENLVSFQYIKDLHELHENWLTHAKYPVPGTVMTVDADKPVSLLERDFDLVKFRIQQMLKKKDNPCEEDLITCN